MYACLYLKPTCEEGQSTRGCLLKHILPPKWEPAGGAAESILIFRLDGCVTFPKASVKERTKISKKFVSD